MPLKCVLPVFVITVSSFAMMPFLSGCQAQDCGCPPLWTAFQSHCYRYFSVQHISWLRAEMHCRSFSIPCTGDDCDVTLGHLTSIHSREELDFLSALYEDLRNKLTTDVTKVWIGFHDTVVEGRWQWSDGSPTDFTRWTSGQPNNYNNQDCAEFQYTSLAYEWHDVPCEPSRTYDYAPTAFICKLPKW